MPTLGTPVQPQDVSRSVEWTAGIWEGLVHFDHWHAAVALLSSR